VVREVGRPLFAVSDGEGRRIGTAGLAERRVAGSFMHLIDVERAEA
jgi:cobyrinic acid a,c-diamide synthase